MEEEILWNVLHIPANLLLTNTVSETPSVKSCENHFSQNLHFKLGFFFPQSKPEGPDKLASYLPNIKCQHISVISVTEVKCKLDE